MRFQNIKFVLEDNQTEQLFEIESNIHLHHDGQNYLVGIFKHKLAFFLLENQSDCGDDEQIISFVEDESLIQKLLTLCPEDITFRYNQQTGNSKIIIFEKIRK